MTASHPQYFIVTDSISPHSNSQQLTVIHCDEPNTGFEPRLISAHFLPAALVGGYVLSFFGTFSLEFYCVQEWLGWKIMGKMFEQQRPGWLINLAVLLAITAVSFAAHFLFQQFWKLVDWLIGMIPKPGKKAAAEQSK